MIIATLIMTICGHLVCDDYGVDVWVGDDAPATCLAALEHRPGEPVACLIVVSEEQ